MEVTEEHYDQQQQQQQQQYYDENYYYGDNQQHQQEYYDQQQYYDNQEQQEYYDQQQYENNNINNNEEQYNYEENSEITTETIGIEDDITTITTTTIAASSSTTTTPHTSANITLETIIQYENDNINYEEEQLYLSLSHRSKCIFEIYTSERSLLAHLNHFIRFYLEGVKSQNILDNSTILEIFSNIEQIRDYCDELCQEMKKRFQEGSEDIATVFISKENKIKQLFISYSFNHSNLVENLSRIIEKKPHFAQFLQSVKENPLNQSRLDLPSFLIMPVQRMVRYQLLFNEVVKHTDQTHPDFTLYEKATELASSITRSINEKIRQHQNFIRVEQIQSNLVGGPKITTSTRLFVREGGMMKVCRKEDKFRWFFLFSDALMYCTSTNLQQTSSQQLDANGIPVKFQPPPNSSNHSFTFHRLLLLKDINKIKDLKDRDNQKNAFQIVSSTEKSFTVYCETLKEKLNWLNDFKELLDHSKIESSKGAYEHNLNSEEVPVWIPDKEAVKCMFCNDVFTIINRRHHCRNCGKVVCGSCSPHKRLISNIKKNKPVRVCLFCYDYIGINEKEHSSSSASISSSSHPSSSTAKNNGSSTITSINYLDKLNYLLENKRRSISFSYTDTHNQNVYNDSSSSNINHINSMAPSQQYQNQMMINQQHSQQQQQQFDNNNNIPNSSNGLSNKEHYSTFRRLKNKISTNKDNKEKEKELLRSQSEAHLNSTGTANINGRGPIRGAIPLPTTLSHGNLRPMIPITTPVVLKNVNNSNNNEQKFQSPEFPNSKISSKPPPSQSVINSLNKPPVLNHVNYQSQSQSSSQPIPQPQQLNGIRKPIRANSQPPAPEASQVKPLPTSNNVNPLGKSTPIPPPSRPKAPPPRTSLEPFENNNVEQTQVNIVKRPPPVIPQRNNSDSNMNNYFNNNNVNDSNVTSQLQELEIKTPAIPKLVNSIPQKPAAPFRKRSSTTSAETSIASQTIQQQQQQQQSHQPQPQQQSSPQPSHRPLPIPNSNTHLPPHHPLPPIPKPTPPIPVSNNNNIVQTNEQQHLNNSPTQQHNPPIPTAPVTKRVARPLPTIPQH